MEAAQIDAIQAWVEGATDVTVAAWGNQPQDSDKDGLGDATVGRPDLPYASMGFTSRNEEGQLTGRMRQRGDPNGDEVRDLYQNMQAVLAVSFFGRSDLEAEKLARQLKMSRGKVSLMFPLEQNHLSILRVVSELDNTVLRDTHWKGRYDIEIAIGYCIHDTDEPGVIDRATFDVGVDNPTRNFTVDSEDAQ